jgi:hypothetical protein
MSRSTRKPVITQRNHGHPADPNDKRLAARRVRKTAQIQSGSAFRKVSNPYDVCDYKFYDPTNPKARRK